MENEPTEICGIWSISVVGGGHRPPGQKSGLEGIISPIPNPGTQISLSQSLLLGVPNIWGKQLTPHCLPGEASNPSSWPLKKPPHVASSNARRRWGLGCRALSQVRCWITDGQWQHWDQRGGRRGGGPRGWQWEQGADALHPVTTDPGWRMKDGLAEEEPAEKALLCPREQMLSSSVSCLSAVSWAIKLLITVVFWN